MSVHGKNDLAIIVSKTPPHPPTYSAEQATGKIYTVNITAAIYDLGNIHAVWSLPPLPLIPPFFGISKRTLCDHDEIAAVAACDAGARVA